MANRMFDAYTTYLRLEGEAHDAVMVALGLDPEDVDSWHHDDFTHDYYDGSYELKDADPAWTPTPDQIRATFALGFACCWICYRDGSEAHYSRRDDRPDSEWGQRRSRATPAPSSADMRSIPSPSDTEDRR